MRRMLIIIVLLALPVLIIIMGNVFDIEWAWKVAVFIFIIYLLTGIFFGEDKFNPLKRTL